MKKFLVFVGTAFFTFAAICNTTSAAEPKRNFFRGINFPDATFGKAPSVIGKDYIWPGSKRVNMYADEGFNIFRVGFYWKRIQPAAFQPLDPRGMAALDEIVNAASARQVTILLDVHNYGSYDGDKLIGSDDVPVAVFNDLWTRLATHYRDNPYVAFGLMNEPNKQSADEWAAIAQEAIYAIRKTGAKQLILVPGTRWDGAHSWMSGLRSNADALANIKDPENNYIFEAHQYLDSNSSGLSKECVSEDVGVKRLEDMTKWLRKTKHKGFLGEFGAAKDPVCMEALRRMFKYMADNNDVWYGWTYWAAAPWFGNYAFNVYPFESERFPQVDVIKEALQGY
ncbi:MAG: glycoside hydrolase family 5 protein [Bdellovibrionales bacterium]